MTVHGQAVTDYFQTRGGVGASATHDDHDVGALSIAHVRE